MTKGTIKKNYILNVGNQLMNILGTLATTPYLSRVLGADGIGAFSYAEAIASYFVLVAILGTGTYAPREISYVQDDKEKRSRVFFEVLLFRFITTALMLMIYIICMRNKVLLSIMSINILAVAFDVSWFFQGIEAFEKIVTRNIVFKILYLLFVFLFIKSPGDLLKYTLGSAILNIAGNVSLWSYLPAYITGQKITEIRAFRNLKVILSLLVPTIAIQIYTIFDKTMLGLFTETDFENGYYEQAMKIIRVVQVVVTALSAVMAPRIGYYFSKSRQDKVREYMLKAFRFVWLISIPLAFGIMGISDNLVPWFMGTGYDKVIILLKILPILTVIIGISQITGIQYLIPTNRQNILTKSVVIGATVNFCINLILIPKLYSVGAAIASVIAEIVITGIQLWYVRKELDVREAMISGKNYLLAGIVMIIVLRLENLKFTVSVTHTMLMIFSGSLCYFGMLLIMKDEFFINNIWEIVDRVKRYRRDKTND
ncbi:flippase [Oribacterium sp. FC2011]|uniref:flippase n=1 Tax=Oribacterium sp. FC2011 TaxID=1408311 RepID=UPI0004E14FDB|nr:flippase [Oribacterium sp. FC2011]